MMARCSITITVKVAWWVRLYIKSVALFAAMTGMQPDAEKVARTCMRGIRPVIAA